jgi:hypothetical protein
MTLHRIPGGYYIKARCIADSDVAHAPPHVREIWDFFLRRAMFRDGRHVERGALSTSYTEIRSALAWSVGWRKVRYTKSQCESAMKWLKKADMITTRRTTHGFIITVCNYERYQCPANYESHEEGVAETAGMPQTPDATEKKEKNKEVNLSPGEGDTVHRLLVESPSLRAMTYEQDMKVRQDFKATPWPLDWQAIAQATVAEAELMSEPIRNPALFWRRQIQKAVDGEFPTKTPAARIPGDETSLDRLARELIQ